MMRTVLATVALACTAYALSPEENTLLAMLQAKKATETRTRRAGHLAPPTQTEGGTIAFVFDEVSGKEIGIQIADNEPLLYAGLEPRMEQFQGASLGFAGTLVNAGYKRGLTEALPIMAAVPALQVKEDLTNHLFKSTTGIQDAVDAGIKTDSDAMDKMLKDMTDKMAQIKIDNKKKNDVLVEEMAKLTKTTNAGIDKITKEIGETITKATKEPIAKATAAVTVNEKRFTALKQLQENSLFLDGKNPAQQPNNSPAKVCADYKYCAQTKTGYDNRRFWKVDFNPGSPGSWHDSLYQLNQGCRLLNDELMKKGKPYGLDRKLKPVCNHANTHNTDQCVVLPGTYFSHCYNSNRHCYGLSNDILYRTVTSDNMYWGGTSLLSHEGNNNHSWRHGRNNHWRYTLCTSIYFRGTGPDAAWKE